MRIEIILLTAVRDAILYSPRLIQPTISALFVTGDTISATQKPFILVASSSGFEFPFEVLVTWQRL